LLLFIMLGISSFWHPFCYILLIFKGGLVIIMRNKRKFKYRWRVDRRKTQDRRTGYERRTAAGHDLGDNGIILDTQEACLYLKISRPTYLKYITSGKIKAQKIGRGWRVIKDELDRFIRGD
jgi:excisionase family DNA binding protein